MISTIQSIIAAECYLGEYHMAINEDGYRKMLDAIKISREKVRLSEWKAKIKLYPLKK